MIAQLIRRAHLLLGLLLIAFGAATFVFPELLSHYSIAADQSDNRIALRAIIGGGEIGIGVYLAFANFFGAQQKSLNLAAAILFLSVGLARFVATTLEPSSEFLWQPVREASIEVVLGFLALLAFGICRAAVGDDSPTQGIPKERPT